MWAALDFTLKTALAIFSIPCTGFYPNKHVPEAFAPTFEREKLCRQHHRTR